MGKLRALKPKVVLKALLRAGFYIYHQRGSHIQLRHLQKTHLRVTIPYHSRFDLPASIVASISKQAELSREEFIDLL